MMSREAADRDRQAAEYWRGVAQADRSEARLATTNAQALSSAARREDQTPGRSEHRSSRQR